MTQATHTPGDLVERLRERAEKIRGHIKSSQLIVDLLQPEMDKFEARTGHDLYTVRMAVDHKSSIRTQAKELADLDETITRIKAQDELITRMQDVLSPFSRVAALDIGESESDRDVYRSASKYALAPVITVGHLRAALAVLTVQS